MNPIHKDHIIWADYVRALAVMAVVVLHVSGFYVQSIYAEHAKVWWSLSNIHTFNWWVANVFDASVRWCVPVFVMLSGALLLDPSRRETAIQFYRKRIHRILIPLVFWVIIYSLINIFYRHQSFDKAWHLVLLGTPFYHLWYLYMLLGLYLIAPPLRKLVQHFSSRVVTVIAWCALLLAVVWSTFFYRINERPGYFIFWCVNYAGYFLLGYQLSIRTVKKRRVFVPSLCLLLSIIATAVGVSAMLPEHGPKTGLYLYDYLSPTTVIMSISVFVLFIRKASHGALDRWMRELSVYTLGIYLIHPLLIILIESFNRFFWAQSALLIPIMAMVVYMLSYYIIIVCKKIPWLRLAVG